jgi:hypothetical protein
MQIKERKVLKAKVKIKLKFKILQERYLKKYKDKMDFSLLMPPQIGQLLKDAVMQKKEVETSQSLMLQLFMFHKINGQLLL